MNKSYNDIRTITEDWLLDDRNNLPYSGQSVQAFIKKMFNSKGGDFYYDSSLTKYLIFADSASRELYLSNREEYSNLLLGTFDAPANYTAEITMTTPSSNVILSGTTGNYIDFIFDIKNKTGDSTGDSVIATFTFNNGGNIVKETRIYDAGTNVHFLADSYLKVGTNNINITITGRNTLVSTVSAVSFTVVNLELDSSFNFAQAVTKGTYVHIPYSLKGANVKYLEWYIDGVLDQDIDTVVGLDVSATKDIDTESLNVGKHSIQARAYITEGGTNYYSKSLYFDFVVKPTNDEWENDVTYVLLGLKLDVPVVSGTPSISSEQYSTIEYGVAVYDSRNRALNLVVTDNGDQIKSISMPINEVDAETYTPYVAGNHTLSFTVDQQVATFSVVAAQGNISVSEESDGLLLKLSSKGRSNNESNPGTWEYQQTVALGGNTISTTFTNFSWNAQSGWNNNALVIPAGSSIEIGINPLAGNPITKGRTIEIDFETEKISDESSSVVNLTDLSTGLYITASSAALQTSGGTKVETKFRSGDRIHLSFIVNRTDDTDNSRMIYIVNNGILERASRFADNDSIGVSGNSVVIGSSGCTIKLYSVRVYDKALRVDQAFQNYAIDSNSLIDIAAFNDIYDNRGNIDVDKVSANIPVMIITGDISSIMSISDKSHKNDWNTDPVNIEFRNMKNPEMNFFIDDADIRLQGTSSISYPRKNFRIYSKSKSGKYTTKFYTPTHNNEDLVSNGKYSFKPGSAPVTCWCLKADFAESSGSHNTGIARLWNSVMKGVNSNGEYILRTNAQKWAALNDYPYDVRTTIDGFPIVLFQRDTTTSPLVCLGQYNFNNDKSTEDVYGFTQLSKDGVTPFDNSKVECWEVLDSDNEIALFTDTSDFDNSWDNAFEARYPDKNSNTTALKSVAQFINSCYDSTNDTINVATWRAGKASHFDLNKLAAYYIYLIRFGAVDQTVKNAMFTTEDGEHWFYINYDNDTVLGIDNESRLFDTWDYGLFTQTPNGGYYYAGKGKSVLWRCFEADSECMALAKQIDKLLFNAGLTYENVCEMFDDLQSSQWCERIYNENGRYKYVSQALAGQNVLHMLQGSRKSHRHWWLHHRFEKYDNMFGNGTYTTRSIQARSTGTVNISQGASYKFIPAIDSNFGYSVASTVVDQPTARTADVEYTATGLPQETGVGNLIYIYNANNIKSIDLSVYINALGSLNVGDATDVYGGSKLAKIVLGDGENENNYLTNISGLSSVNGLEELDIRGYKAITNLELSSLINLHKINAANSGLTSFAPANGTTLTQVILPDTILAININGSVVNDMTYTPTSTLKRLSIRNVSGSWNVKSFVTTWVSSLSDEQLSQAELTLSGINWTNVSMSDVIAIGKIGTKNLQGRITLSSITEEGYQQIVSLFGNTVFQPDAAFVIDAPASMFLQGPTEVVAGASDRFTATVFPVTSLSILYLLYNNGQLISSSTDANGKVYRTYGGVTLYEESGIISVDNNIASNVNLLVRALLEDGSVLSSFTNVAGKKISYPSGITIAGTAYIDHPNQYTYTKQITGDYTASILNVAWSLSQTSAASIVSSNNDTATLNVTSISGTQTIVQLTCTITFTGNVTRTSTKSISLQYSYPSSVIIDSGDNSITTIGDYTYTKSFNTDDFTSSVIDVSWLLSNPDVGTITTALDGSGVFTVNPIDDINQSITITCAVTFSGNVVKTGTKSVNVNVRLPVGIFAAYNDGSYREYEYADTDAIGVAVLKGNSRTSGFIIDKTHDSNGGKQWGGYGTTITGITTTSSADVAKVDNKGESNTDGIITQLGSGNAPAADWCRQYSYMIDGYERYGFLGSCGQWQTAYNNKTNISNMLSKIGGTAINNQLYWTSTLNSSYPAWYLSWGGGTVGSYYKSSGYYVRPFYAIA